MEINITQLVAMFLPAKFQASFFIIVFLLWEIGNIIMPFLSKYKFNSWLHFFYLALTGLKVDKDTKQVTFNLPAEVPSSKQPAPAVIKPQEDIPNAPIQQVSASQPDPSITL